MTKAVTFVYMFFSNLLNPNRLCVCRFEPSCTAYAVSAVETHGPYRGTKLVFARLIKCHPWGRFGLDPVPPQDRPQR